MELADPAIDFLALAKGFGVTGRSAATLDEVRSALSEALAAPGPTLIDIAIDGRLDDGWSRKARTVMDVRSMDLNLSATILAFNPRRSAFWRWLISSAFFHEVGVDGYDIGLLCGASAVMMTNLLKSNAASLTDSVRRMADETRRWYGFIVWLTVLGVEAAGVFAVARMVFT
jgi:hypothetical protein